MTEQNSTIICKKCGVIHETKNLIVKTIPLPKGSHKKATCPTCQSFIKFLPHTVPTLYFGKYKGKSISEIAQKDPSYLEWLLSKGVKSARLKSAIEETLCKISK
jgi:uncharacterized protein (DUF3820 family)